MITPITEAEFKEIFGLSEECIIPEDTLKEYSEQLEGTYLLYLDINNISKEEFKNVDGTALRAFWTPFNVGVQYFVNTLGSSSKIDVYYLKDDGSSTPFWTYTKYSKDEVLGMKNKAYRKFITSVLDRLGYEYRKYHLKFSYCDFATQGSYAHNCHPNGHIWWDGVEYNELYYKNGDSYFTIGNNCIQHSITNRSGIWNGKIHPPIERIFNEVLESSPKTL